MANKATSPPEHVENLVILLFARRHVVIVSIQLPQEYSTAFFLFFFFLKSPFFFALWPYLFTLY